MAHILWLTSVFGFRVVVLNEYCLRAGSYYEAWPSIVVRALSLSPLAIHLSMILPRTDTWNKPCRTC